MLLYIEISHMVHTSRFAVCICLCTTGMMVQGMTKAPRSPFTTTYVDDNVEKSQTAMYMGKLNNV